MASQLDKLKFLIGNGTTLTDDEFQVALDLNDTGDDTEQLYMAAALCCERLAADASGQFTSEKLGDYSVTFKNNDVSWQTQATRYRDLVYNTPAFATAELATGPLAEMEILRNYILRTGSF